MVFLRFSYGFPMVLTRFRRRFLLGLLHRSLKHWQSAHSAHSAQSLNGSPGELEPNVGFFLEGMGIYGFT